MKKEGGFGVKDNALIHPTHEFVSYLVFRTSFLPTRSAYISKTQVEMQVETQVETKSKTPDIILHILSSHPGMTLAEVAERAGKSLSAIERAASKLVKEGRLHHVGPKKGGYWKVQGKAHE